MKFRIQLAVISFIFGTFGFVSTGNAANCGAWMTGDTADEVESGCASMGQLGVFSCFAGTESVFVCQCINSCFKMVPVQN